jgi:hypothetical protein
MRKAKAKTKAKATKRKVSPIPKGYHSVTPYLSVRGAAAAIEFYKKAFGAREIMRMPGPTGNIGHAEIEIGGSRIMLADEYPEIDFLSRPSAQRYSTATVRPSIQPSSRSRWTKAAYQWPWVAGVPDPMIPIVGSFPGCCARTASGHAAAAPPSRVMNSRRLMDSPQAKEDTLSHYWTAVVLCITAKFGG